jgi:hypothetical protein
VIPTQLAKIAKFSKHKWQELFNLKHSHHRLLAEKGSELSHAMRQAEKDEREVRKFKLEIGIGEESRRKYTKSTLHNENKNSNTDQKRKKRHCNVNKNYWDMKEDSGSDLMDSRQKSRNK